jgi:hypothetical protein
MKAVRAAAFMLLLPALAVALVQTYSVAPTRASWSGKVKYDVGVGEIFTLNADEPVYCEYLTGAASSGQYNAVMETYPGQVEVAHGDTTDDRAYSWVRCSLRVTTPDSIIRGKQYLLRVTRTAAGIPA